MATTVAVLEAVLRADTRQFDTAMGKSEGRMQKVGKAAGLAGLAIAGGRTLWSCEDRVRRVGRGAEGDGADRARSSSRRGARRT